MPTNIYFSQKVKSEQSLYEDIIIESLKIYGQDVYYLPREIVNEDKIFGEDVPSKFGSSYKIEMYIDNIEGFDGEGDLFSKFGVQIRDQATFTVARRRWSNTVGQMDNQINSVRPREGDLIYLQLSNKLFEIMQVEHEQPFYQLSNLPTYKMRCELFEYNDENLETGIDAIDTIEDIGYKIRLNLDASVRDAYNPADYDDLSYTPMDFVIGDNVYQLKANGSTIRGEVYEYNRDSDYIVVGHIGTDSGVFGMFEVGTITNDRSDRIDSDNLLFPLIITREILSTAEILASQNSYAQNDVFDTEENSLVLDFLDFSETNPFGDPGD